MDQVEGGLTMTAFQKQQRHGIPARGAAKLSRNRLEATRQFYATARVPQGDPRMQMIDAMCAAGLVPTEPERIVADGGLHRFHVDGDKHRSRNGWCALHVDGGRAFGAFGSWKANVTRKWCAGGERLSRSEQVRMNTFIVEAKRQREAETRQRWEQARDDAQAFWQSAAAAHATHPYLIRKQVKAHGIRQSNRLLLIPLRDADGVLWSVETIAPDGSKRFLRDGRKRGCYYAIGTVKDVVLIAEGFATAASLHEATGHAVAVAFDCGNMEPVARALRAKFPQARIVIAADNDLSAGNPGLTKARAAAAAVGGTVAIPPPGMDFNDVACTGVIA